MNRRSLLSGAAALAIISLVPVGKPGYRRGMDVGRVFTATNSLSDTEAATLIADLAMRDYKRRRMHMALTEPRFTFVPADKEYPFHVGGWYAEVA